MASNTDDTFAQYKKVGGIAIGVVLLAAILDACTAPSKEEIAEAKAASAAVVEARRMAVENPGAEAEEKIKPVEKLAVAEKVAEPGPPRDGATVYQAACMACHAAGVMDSPKLEAGAWDNRIHKGLDGLTTSAINGINNMPARGGNPAITDEEMKSAVAYMLTESGYDPDAEAQSADAEPAKPAIDPAVMEEIKAAAAEAKAAAEAAKISTAEAKAAMEAAKTSAAEAKAAVEDANATMSAQVQALAAVGTGAAAMAVGTEMAEAGTETADSVGRQVYESTCFTCHDVGIFDSPKMSDKAAWNDRIGAGIDALYATAIKGNGTNTKPAMGGHPDLSEAQVKAAVDYMLDTAGVDMSADTGSATQATEATQETTEAAQPAAEEKAEATTEQAADATQEAAPAAEATEAAQEEAPTTEATDAAQESAEEAPAAEEKAEEAETTGAVQTGAATAALAAEVKQEAPAAAAAPSWASIDGKKVYDSICFSCHATGIAQAPIPGKATAWEARVSAGMDTIYNNAINGKGIMPARGGRPTLTDDEIKAAVDWMVQQSQ